MAEIRGIVVPELERDLFDGAVRGLNQVKGLFKTRIVQDVLVGGSLLGKTAADGARREVDAVRQQLQGRIGGLSQRDFMAEFIRKALLVSQT